ncbi:hypothetical protein QT982_32565 [Microcoleus sp. herbarium2]
MSHDRDYRKMKEAIEPSGPKLSYVIDTDI